MTEPSYRQTHPPEPSSDPRPKRIQHEVLLIKDPVDLLEWIDDKRGIEDIKENVPVLLGICRQPHPPWGTDWGPWLRAKYYR